ncbi:hypothetical protein [Salinispira pacifica]|uniref:Uncharacterized protein n=1 Tax=Salinispira pacifica TaxID=1307761 RepID=V5WIS2_9SPIO|nr:hypothetical protein [Salinispira pacifica]AHC15464.1 hypothetical protein L21SP2_2097 [Salinispira pacifica]
MNTVNGGVIATIFLVLLLLSCQPASRQIVQYANNGLPEPVYGDIRDGIYQIPADKHLNYYAKFGVTREMFADPSIMTDQDVSSLERAITSLIKKYPDDYTRMLNEDSDPDRIVQIDVFENQGSGRAPTGSAVRRQYGVFSTVTVETEGILMEDDERNTE